MKSHILTKDEYLTDWPAHYFDIKDINTRHACLKKYVEEHPEAQEEKRRLEIFEKRFGKREKKERADQFIKSFMMILISYRNNLNGLNINRQERELKSELKNLCVLDWEYDDILGMEWENFAEVYLMTCSTHSYRSTLFGFVTLKDDAVGDRMASEIDIVTRLAPGQIKLDKECERLREIFVNTFISRIENGEEYWESYMSRHGDDGIAR